MISAAAEPVVAPATAHDVEVLFGIYRDLAASGAADPEPGLPLREAFGKGWIRRRRVYVARVDDRTAGGYFLRSNFPAMVGHIAQAGYLVNPAMRRRGIGARLLEHSLDEATLLGFRARMFNLVMQGNPSRRLYERAGFEVIGSVPELRGSEPGLIYWRRLP